jgi:glycine cleavage system regulatory protein
MSRIKKAAVVEPFAYAAGRNLFFVAPLVADKQESPVAVLQSALLLPESVPQELSQLLTTYRDKYPHVPSQTVPQLPFTFKVGDAYELERGVMHATVYGADRPGTLEYATGLFQNYRVNVEQCFGKRLKNLQGSQFEFDTSYENVMNVLRMFEDLMTDKVPAFKVCELSPFDRVFDLDMRFAKDRCGLLYPVAAFLAEHGVNLRYFEARKDDLSQLLGSPEVRVRGTLELPPGLDHRDVFEGLRKRKVTPRGTYTELKELYRVENGQVVKGSVVLSF